MALTPIYAKGTDDYSDNGLGLLTPLECTVKEQAAGMYELSLVQPIDNTLRWAQITCGCKVKAACPVRESPIYDIVVPDENENVSVVREIWRVVKTSVGVRLRTGPGTGYKRLSTHKNDTLVIKLDQPNSSWMHVIMVDGGAEGYMSTKYLAFDHQETEIITPENPAGTIVHLEQSRDQIFTIYSVETDTESQTVTAKGMHAFYDQRGNLIDAEYEPSNLPLETVVSDINSKLMEENPISWHVQGASGNVTGTYSYKNPVEAYLDPDEGIVAQTKSLLVRDNFNAYLIPDNIRDRGVTVRRGKNLIGVEVTNDTSGAVTRVIPVGKKKNGDPLYLSGGAYPTKYIDSPRIGDYPTVMVKRIEYDVSVGDPKDDNKDKVFKTEALAMAELKRRAEEEYSKNGIDLPAYGMEVDFVLLQNTADYANYASLQAVHLYDTVTVIDELIGLTAKVRVTGYEWNVLTGQYDSITLGELLDVKQTVYSYNLPDGGISGNKIMNNSMPGTAMRNATIEYAKITNAAIEQLAANAMTALTARIKEIVAQKLTTDELYAVYSEMIALKASTITADNIETDALAAELARITVLAAGTASFDAATIQHLVAAAMNLEFGVAGQVFIRNLAVEYAQMVGATIGELCIKASDGNYYLMDVKPDGTVTATKTTVTEGEINAGQTSGGKMILETNIIAASLNAGNLLATYALINRIDAARIDVDQLFAREAFIGMLRTTKIVGDKSVMIIAQEAAASNANFRQNTMPTGEDFVRIGDIWVNPDTGITYQAADASAYNLRFALDENGDLYYELEGAPDDYKLEVRGYDLYSSGIYISIREDGSLGVPYVWMRVQDQEVLNTIDDLEDKVDGKTAIYYQNTAPSNPEERDLWYKDDGKIYRYSGGEWVDVTTTTLKAALDAAQTAQDTIDDYVSEMDPIIEEINGNIAELQKQIDGSISTWFYEGVPTLNNLPASEWTTNAIRDEHLGDLYYDTTTSMCYRFQKSGSTYSWVVVADSDVSKALEIASKAQDTADSKRRVFVERPAPPYDVGDLWVQGTSGDIMRCQSAKSEGSAYAASDWIKASKYTDDTAADKAQATADGKIVTFAQASAPTAAAIGDLWLDTDNDNMLYRWNGSKWVPYRDQLIVQVQEQADFATVYDSATPPAAPIKTGKLWLDRGVSPVVLRRWKGLDVGTAVSDGGWEIVNDPATINEAIEQLGESALSKEEFSHYVKARTDGLYVGLLDADGSEGYSHGYTRITYSSFDVVDGNGKVTNSLGDARQDLGNLTIYTTVDGHTAFVPREVW